MASACVNSIGRTHDGLCDHSPCSAYDWLSPRISFSREITGVDTNSEGEHPTNAPEKADSQSFASKSSPKRCTNELIDFEFRLDDPVTMLPADELFSDGKLIPLQVASMHPTTDMAVSAPVFCPPDGLNTQRRSESTCSEVNAPSPKAPRCSSRWRKFLGFKKQSSSKPEPQREFSVRSENSNPKSLKLFIHRNNKSSEIDSPLNLPLLRDSDSESVSLSSRLSLSSSSSSGAEHEDLPRLSLDSDKCKSNASARNRNQNASRAVYKPRTSVDKCKLSEHHAGTVCRRPMRRAPNSNSFPARGVSVDSPRMNSCGKIVFHSLERSSSSPSSFNGRSGSGSVKHRSMERSYSANVRITPVLNVPVCYLRGSSKSGSIFGLGQLFSPQKRDGVPKMQIWSRRDRK